MIFLIKHHTILDPSIRGMHMMAPQWSRAVLFSFACLLLVPFTQAQNATSAPVGIAPAPSANASYIAINCGGLTPVNTSIPSYYGGVTYGAGPFFSPNNTVVSTSNASAGVIFAPDAYYSGESTKPLSYSRTLNASVADAALYLTERYGLSFR
jgi:hypothetical protein